MLLEFLRKLVNYKVKFDGQVWVINARDKRELYKKIENLREVFG